MSLKFSVNKFGLITHILLYTFEVYDLSHICPMGLHAIFVNRVQRPILSVVFFYRFASHSKFQSLNILKNFKCVFGTKYCQTEVVYCDRPFNTTGAIGSKSLSSLYRELNQCVLKLFKEKIK